jgi:hypothetical protein
MQGDSRPQGMGLGAHCPSVSPPWTHGAAEDGRHYCRAMTKWEYATVPLLVHATKQILDTWGSDGWELVQVVPGPNSENMVAYLKRPIGGGQ